MGGRFEGWTVWTRGRTDLIFLGLVRGGHVSQILDHLLGVLRLTRTRLSSTRQKKNTVEGFREGWSKKHKRVTVKSWYKTIKIMLIQHQKYCYSNMLCGVYVDICNSRAKNGLVFTICRKDVQMFIMQPLQNNNAACSKWAYVITTAHTVFTCTTGSTLATDRKSISGFLWLERGAAEFLTNRLITNRLP